MLIEPIMLKTDTMQIILFAQKFLFETRKIVMTGFYA